MGSEHTNTNRVLRSVELSRKSNKRKNGKRRGAVTKEPIHKSSVERAEWVEWALGKQAKFMTDPPAPLFIHSGNWDRGKIKKTPKRRTGSSSIVSCSAAAPKAKIRCQMREEKKINVERGTAEYEGKERRRHGKV